MGKDAAGNPTSGRLDASASTSPLTSVVLSDNLLIDVQVDSASAASIDNGDTFTVISGNSAFSDPLLPIGITVQSNDPNTEFTAARGGTNNQDVVLTARQRPRQILDADTASAGC